MTDMTEETKNEKVYYQSQPKSEEDPFKDRFNIVLVEPLISGNIGAVARAMKNFGFYNLVMVNPCEIDLECRCRAKHANDIIEGAKVFDNFDDALSQSTINIGTTGVVNLSNALHSRNPISVKKGAKKAAQAQEITGIVFGREDKGLFNSEITKMDMLISIPTHPRYPIMNLSHAVAVVLWEIHSQSLSKQFRLVPTLKDTGALERDLLVDRFTKILEIIEFDDQRMEKCKVLFRRMLGRSVPTKWEYHALMGVFTEVLKNLNWAKQN